MPKTIIEPFRIKMIEPIKMMTKKERQKALEKAHNNVFLLPAEDCCLDLLTDSGTGAMSDRQWAAMMIGDESYAGSRSWFHFEKVVRDITGMKHVFPTHQGRAAEGILAAVKLKPGDVVPNNSHFVSTRANIEYVGAKAVDCMAERGLDPSSEMPFKGDMDLDKLLRCIETHGKERIPFGILTITNNNVGGQPVSMANIKAVKKLLQKHEIPLVVDACRFAENAYFIQRNEPGYSSKTLTKIAQEIFAHADAAFMSCKKEGMANIGGFFVCNDDKWAEAFSNLLVLREGFPTYGGLAGRDLEAIAVGLKEALEYDYQEYRHASIKYIADRLEEKGIPFVKPVGGHAIFLDAKLFLPHIDSLKFPGIALVNALYLEGGIRGVEIGSAAINAKDKLGNELPADIELVRLAFPRRVYTQSHFDYLIEVIDEVWQHRDTITGYCISKQPKSLRHFSCHYKLLT